jgi:hypothetical protein
MVALEDYRVEELSRASELVAHHGVSGSSDHCASDVPRRHRAIIWWTMSHSLLGPSFRKLQPPPLIVHSFEDIGHVDTKLGEIPALLVAHCGPPRSGPFRRPDSVNALT